MNERPRARKLVDARSALASGSDGLIEYIQRERRERGLARVLEREARRSFELWIMFEGRAPVSGIVVRKQETLDELLPIALARKPLPLGYRLASVQVRKALEL
jgi:hypothetical protein